MKGEMCMKKFFKQRGKKLTAVATAFALLCTVGVLPENVRHASAAEETGSSQAEEQVPEEDQTSGEGLALTRENFPDRVFRSYLQGYWKECDKDGDGKLSDKELHSLTIFETNVNQDDDSSPKIKSLRGIEKLKYLEKVEVYGNSIRGALDVSGLSDLTSLRCGGNKITSIVLPEESKLKVLECSLDPITFLDLKGQTELEQLDCPMSSLKTLDLTNQTKLKWLNVGNSALTSLILPDHELIDGKECTEIKADLTQDYVDFKEATVFPGFNLNRIQNMQLKKNGKKPVELSLDTLKADNFRIEGLDLGDKITYTYNCAAGSSKDPINIEFSLRVGAIGWRNPYPPASGEGLYPPEYEEDQKMYYAPPLIKRLSDITLMEGWQWEEGTDTAKKIEAGKLTTAAAIYTAQDAYYYRSSKLNAEISIWGCTHPSESVIHHEAKAPTLTEKGNIEYYECEGCGDCYTQPDDFSSILSKEETELPILYLADDVESTVSRIGYGQKIDNLDIFRVRWNENSGITPVYIDSMEIEKVSYQKDENADKEEISGNSGFGMYTVPAGLEVSKENPREALGGVCYYGKEFLKPGKYFLDVALYVSASFSESEQAQRQKISLQRTIIIEKKKDTPGIPEASMEVPYTTNVVGQISLKENWKWASGDSEKALAVGEAVTVTAEYIGTDADLYEDTVEVTVTRLACDHPEDKLELRNKKDNVCGNGYTGDYFCTQCKEIAKQGEMIPAHHDLTLVPAKAATDTMPGNMAYYVCGDCGKCFEDEGGTKETTKDKVTIPALGTPVPSVTPVPTSKATAEPSPTNHPAVTEVPTKEPVKTGTPATEIPTKEPVKTGNPATAVPTKEPVKTENPAITVPTKEPAKTENPATAVPTKELAKTEAPTRQPVTTEPAPAPVTPDLPTPGQSMAPETSQTPAAAAPASTQTPQWTPMATSKLSQKKPARKGKLITDSKGNRYKVTSSNVKNPTVTFYSAKMTAKKVTMSRSVRINGVRYCITAVRSRAFEGHKKVTCIRLGSKVNNIGDRAFRNCKKLEKLYIQSSKLKPEDIGERVFENVPKDLKIYVPEKKKDEYRKMFREKGLGKLISVNSI